MISNFDVLDFNDNMFDVNDMENVDQHDIDSISDSICDIMRDSARKCGSFPTVNTRKGNRTCNKQPWFNRACKEKRQDLLRAFNANRANKNDRTKAERKAASKLYKKTINKQFVETVEAIYAPVTCILTG